MLKLFFSDLEVLELMLKCGKAILRIAGVRFLLAVYAFPDAHPHCRRVKGKSYLCTLILLCSPLVNWTYMSQEWKNRAVHLRSHYFYQDGYVLAFICSAQ